MDLPTAVAPRARELLAADARAVARLRELLLEERSALGQRDLAALERLVQQKLACLQQLEAHERERRELIAQSGAPDWPGLLQALDAAVARDWESLRTQLAALAELNATNEKIVSRTRRSTARLLALLRGQTDAPAAVYDRLGRTHACGDLRAITRA